MQASKMYRLKSITRLLVIFFVVHDAMTTNTDINLGTMNALPLLNNPCSIDLTGQDLSQVYNIDGATYLPNVLLGSINRANHSISTVGDTSTQLSTCTPLENQRLSTFPQAANLEGKTVLESLHLLHNEVIHVLAHLLFARNDFETFRDTCSTHHFTDAFGNEITNSIGNFRNVVCNMMPRIGYSAGVQQNLLDVGNVVHSRRDCPSSRDWTCMLLTMATDALGKFKDYLRAEESTNRNKRGPYIWSLQARKRESSHLQKLSFCSFSSFECVNRRKNPNGLGHRGSNFIEQTWGFLKKNKSGDTAVALAPV